MLNPKMRLFIGIGSLLLFVPLCIVGTANYISNNLFEFVTVTPTSANTVSTDLNPSASVLGIGSTMTGKDGMTLLYVPAGEFIMGNEAQDAMVECQQTFSPWCSLDLFKDEEPPHEVYLDAFWIDQTEVTNKMYAMCVNAGACKLPQETSSYTHSYYYGNSEYDNYPVIYIDWDRAETYCEWADRRLPTEAEWEKAARGKDGRAYPWGNDAPNINLLNFKSNLEDTTPVGNYPDGASPYGALDMAGNVLEWVADWYDASYYISSPSSNPSGPDSGPYRVVRGGSWANGDLGHYVRASNRVGLAPHLLEGDFGFRCAMSGTP